MDMTTNAYPTEEELRHALIDRAKDYCRLTKTSLSALGKKLKNDTALFRQIESGNRNFTIGLYTELMKFFDNNWPPPGNRLAGQELVEGGASVAE